ncbi:unnamed protein product [Closterium sp. NIES-53]
MRLPYSLSASQGKRGRQRATAGVKTAKDRLTIAFICNVDSSETFRPMVISKVRRPRDFTNNRFDPEPYVYWRYNKRGWMTSEIFMAFIESLNAKFFAEERQVVLLVDNASSHRVDTESAVRRDILGFRTVKLSNIRVVYLPPNTTAFTQPLDQGVISAVKARFRQRVIADWLRRWDDRGSPASLQNLKPTVSETVIYLYKAAGGAESRSGRDVGGGVQLRRRHVRTCDFEAPDPFVDEPPRTRGIHPTLLLEPITAAEPDAIRERRRVARRATEILVGYARAENMLPSDLAVIFGINNQDVIDRLHRASRAFINLNNHPQNAGHSEADAPEDTANRSRPWSACEA